MTNLIVSRRCNQSCSYCFAGKNTRRGKQLDFISLEAFEQRLDYLDRSQMAQARFLGGEPTLHPQFPELVSRALAREKTIIVFSNGLMPEKSLEALKALSVEQCSLILNVSSMENAAGRLPDVRRIKKVLECLGPKVQLGCNIYDLNQDLEPFINLIVDNGCRRSIRIGLAQPIVTGNNVFLPTHHYRQAGEQLTRFAYQAARQGVQISLDCGFVRCMFAEADIAQLTEMGADLDWRCSPIIDIDLDQKAFYCFPLADKYWTQLDSTMTASGLRDAFLKKTQPYRQSGIYKECSNCLYKNNHACSGGCLAHIIRRFSSQPVRISFQDVHPTRHLFHSFSERN